MNVDNLFCFIKSCWNFQNQIASYNAIDIFENLTMNRGCTDLGWEFLELQYKGYWLLSHFLITLVKP
jgi:hypothetical protein